MGDIVVQVENLSKRYKIGLEKRHDTLRDHIAAIAQRWIGKGRQLSTDGDDTIWALKDVSFEVKEGEVVGIIGRNGAGKSTLLKILSHITEPTEGCAELYGRVGSLLDVGTGFHQELTGRENIYLSGAIFGMPKAEIKRKFDEIVAFSEIEKFLDTPVKRYSSGMYVRLAFSVAAFLEPEILFVDEVLAVGDIAFQNKCLERIGTLTESGVTTLIVSHSMASIQRLCPRTIWIEAGRVACDDSTLKTINGYVNLVNSVAVNTVGKYLDTATRRGSGEVRFTEVQILDGAGEPKREFQMGDDILIRSKYHAFQDVFSLEVGFLIRDVRSGVFVTSTSKVGVVPDLEIGQEGVVDCLFKSVQLRPRRYSFFLYLRNSSYQNLAYDVWDGAGLDILVTADCTASESDFLLGYDDALVSLPHLITHRSL